MSGVVMSPWQKIAWAASRGRRAHLTPADAVELMKDSHVLEMVERGRKAYLERRRAMFRDVQREKRRRASVGREVINDPSRDSS